MTDQPCRRNTSLDPPARPRRHLPDHDSHTPQPQRRLLARTSFNPEDYSWKRFGRSTDVCPAGVYHRRQQRRHPQRYFEQAAAILRNRSPVHRPLGTHLHAASHRVLSARHAALPASRGDGHTIYLGQSQDTSHCGAALRSADIRGESLTDQSGDCVRRRAALEVREAVCKAERCDGEARARRRQWRRRKVSNDGKAEDGLGDGQ